MSVLELGKSPMTFQMVSSSDDYNSLAVATPTNCRWQDFTERHFAQSLQL